MEQNATTTAASAVTAGSDVVAHPATPVAGTTDSLPLTAAQLMEEHEKAAAAAASKSASATGDGASAEDASAAAATTIAAAAAAAPKPKKPAGPKAPALDVHSAEAFPSLGGPAPVKSVAPPTWGSKMPAAVTTPMYTNGSAKSALKATGHIKKEITSNLELQEHQKIARAQLRKPMADIGKEIEKKTLTRIQMSTTGAGVTVIIIKGQEANVAMARRELQRELCPKRTITIAIPTSVRLSIIGKGGETIKRLQQETLTRINVPRMLEGEVPIYEDDGTTIDITVEGDPEGTEFAKRKIDAIVAEKTAHTVIRIDDIPGKFYPFIAGAHDQTLKEIQKGKDIKIEIPGYYESKTKELGPASGPIVIRGEKVAANEAKAEIEAFVKNLSSEFTTITVSVPKTHHRFLVGDRGRGIHEILEKSGCSIVVPSPEIPTHSLVVTGPSDKVGNGINVVMGISKSYYTLSLPLHNAHSSSPIGASAHARALARLWQKNGDLKPIEAAHKVEIELPKVLGDNIMVEIIARSEETKGAARDQFKQLVALYPPSRVDSLKIDPLWHPTILGKDGRGLKPILEKYGVHVLIGEQKSYGDEVFLVTDSAHLTEEEAKEKLKEVKDLLEQQVKDLGDIISEQLTIAAKFYGVISNGSTLRALSQGNVSVNHARPEGEEASDITITVRGPSVDVKSTVKKINAWVEESKDNEGFGKQHVINFDYPAQYSAMLIGARGSNVNKLRDELGVDIKLKEGKGEIKGIQINAEVARRRLNEQIKQFEDNTTLRIQVPPEHHRTIIGAQGKFVRRLEEKYSVRINFPKSGREEDAPDGATDSGAHAHNRQLAPNEVMIKGGKKGCAEARSEIEELLKYEIEHGQTATVKIAARCIKGLFTTYMKEFKSIREESGARIDIPNEGDSAPDAVLEIKIKGTKEAVSTARKDLTKIISDLDQLTVEKITVDKKYHRALIGTGGSTLREIVEKAGGPKDRSAQARMVRFPGAESQDDVIRIEGNRSVVEKIVASINKIVEEKQNQIQEVVDVAPEKHARLIGRGGSIRQELEGRFKVTIDIPRQNENEPTQSGVTLTGLPADVAAATAHIIELTKETEGETFNVPKYLHHAIADGGLFIKRLRNELRVRVDHAGEAFPPKPDTAQKPTSNSLPLITDKDHDESSAFSWEVIDNPALEATSENTGDFPWVLRADSAENIQKAKDLISKQIDLVKEQTCIGYLTLPDTSKYRYVVGKGGNEVNRIKEATDCRVLVPKGGEGDAIVVWGSKEGVEKAKEIILETVANAGEAREGGNGWNGGRRRRWD